MHRSKHEEPQNGVNWKFLLLTVFLLTAILTVTYILVITDPYQEPVEGKYGFVGTGTQSDPYLISDLDDLCHFRDLVNSGNLFSGCYFLQTEDIDMSDAGNWTPIGEFGSENYFHGSYNGDGHTLSNLTILGEQHNGLFGMLCGEVRNLGIESGYIEGDCAGSIASHGFGSGAILNCYNKATVHGQFRAGGIADNFPGRISYCWNLGEVTCDSGVVGGISSYDAQIMNCYSYQIPVLPDTFRGTAIDVQQFTSFEEINTWLDQIHTMLYEDKLSRDASGGFDEQLCLLVGDGSTLMFDKTFSQKYTTKKNVEDFWVDHAAILLLVAAALVMVIIMVRRPAALGFVLTVFLVCAGLGLLDRTLTLKQTHGIVPMWSFYLQSDNTIDLLLLGSSFIGVNQDCETLWTDFGISSFALWGPSQPAWNSYYFLNEALKYEMPKVVVYDVSSLLQDWEYADESGQYANVYGMKLSLDKFSAIQASAPQERWGDLLLGFPIYHTRYSELTIADFDRSLWGDPAGMSERGNTVRYGTGSLSDFGNIADAKVTTQITEKQEDFLLKIINRCKKEDIPLLLVASVVPYREVYMPFSNYSAVLAAQYDVPFIDFNLLDAETGITIDDLYLDDWHVNTNGARKQSAYLGQYLKEHYELIDHRGDPRYSSWDAFAVKMQNSYITMIADLSDYLKELVRDDRTVVVIKRLVSEGSSLEELQQTAVGAGFDMSFLNNQSRNGCWIIEHPGNSSKNTYYALDQDISLQLGDDTLSLSVSPFSDRTIAYAGRVFDNLQTGITCVVYDTNTKEVVHVRKIL